MQKIRAVVRTRRAVLTLLVLLAVMVHAAPIILLASSFTPVDITVWFSRDEYLRVVGPPQLSFNFNNLADQRTNALNLTGMSIFGDEFAIQSGAINFGLGSDAFDFAPDVYAWGADFRPIGGGGLINFSFGSLGLSRLVNVTSPTFIGFGASAAFRAINVSFLGPQSNTIFFSAGPASDVNFVIDNVIANSVPEPTTLILLATGAGLLGLSNRRRKRTEVDAGRDGGHQADPM
jgi:PEP-CTERM motif